MLKISHSQCTARARAVAREIRDATWRKPLKDRQLYIYAVPRGGVPAGYLIIMALAEQGISAFLATGMIEADCIVDDIIDSGATQQRYSPDRLKPFFALVNKKLEGINDFVVFPWEETEEKAADDIATRLLQFIGEDVTREGLQETPKRFLKAWKEWTSGYKKDPADVFKVFDDGAEDYDQMIICSPIPFYSHCEHHLAAIFGTVHVGYIPNGKIVGLSKFGRLVDIFAKRLQVQERLTTQIARSINDNLAPKGVAVIVKGRHFCMESRGVNKPGVETTTSAMLGCFGDNADGSRDEFLKLINLGAK